MAKKELISNDKITLRVKENPVINVLDEALDQIEEKLDKIESGFETGAHTVEDTVKTVVTVTKNNPQVLAAVALSSVVLGGYLGYRFGVKRTTTRYERMLAELVPPDNVESIVITTLEDN